MSVSVCISDVDFELDVDDIKTIPLLYRLYKENPSGIITLNRDPVMFLVVLEVSKHNVIEITSKIAEECNFYELFCGEYPEEFAKIKANDDIIRNNYKNDNYNESIKLIDLFIIKELKSEPFKNILPYNRKIEDLIIITDIKLDNYKFDEDLILESVEIRSNIDFRKIDLTNIVIAGGCINSCIRKTHINDIDLFIYGIDNKAVAELRIKKLCKDIKTLYKSHSEKKIVYFKRSKNCLSIIVYNASYPLAFSCEIQIILRLYKSISEILLGFDIDASSVALAKQEDSGEFQLLASERFIHSLKYNVIYVDFSRASKNYEARLVKYAMKGYNIYVPNFDRRNQRKFSKANGLNYLLHAEYKKDSIAHKSTHIDDNDYCHHDRYNNLYVDEICKNNNFAHSDNEDNFIDTDDTEPILCNTTYFINKDGKVRMQYYINKDLDKVLHIDTNKLNKKLILELDKDIDFMIENPGTQLTSSFNPVNIDLLEWYGEE